MTNRATHEPYLPLPAFTQDELQFYAAGAIADDSHFGGMRHLAVYFDAVPQPTHRAFVGSAANNRSIRFRYLVPRMRHPFDQLTVI